MRYTIILICFSLLFSTYNIFAQNVTPDSVRAQKYDMGKMWTFENPPVDYFNTEYGFKPSNEWLEKVRKSALRLSSGCSGSFVSSDGLIMTNHHCVRGLLPAIDTADENFLKDGFYADELSAERKIPGMMVDQLISIEDVTAEIHSEISKGESDSAKVELRQTAIQNILQRKREADEELMYVVTPLYNGGRYSLYGYKRYTDVRLVFVPDLRTAKMGGDYDNFTYPRYGLDCAFLRAYEDNVPVNTQFYFPWSDSGAAIDEAVFVIGNPGTTERIKTIAQMEYDRDIVYPAYVNLLQRIYDIRFEEVVNTNAEDFGLIAKLYSTGNTLKVYKGILNGLRDSSIFLRKKDFEKTFKGKVISDPELNSAYGNLWDELSELKALAAKYYPEILGYNVSPVLSSGYLLLARDIVRLANELNLPEDERSNAYGPDRLKETKLKISSYQINQEIEKKILAANIDFFYERLGSDNELLEEFTGGRKGMEAAEFIIINSELASQDKVELLIEKDPYEILNSDDPLIRFSAGAQEKLAELRLKVSALEKKESVAKQQLGVALFEVYGEEIPPDATFTLRIADGVIKSYPYNGTIAPPFTTFFGVLEKYYSFNKKFPFNLHPMWENLPAAFDLSTPLDFISTNDITGGNSGSAVINTSGEIVGVAFDGNYESLPGNYIYTTEANRTISVHSSGMIEAIRDLYKAERLSDELLNGEKKK